MGNKVGFAAVSAGAGSSTYPGSRTPGWGSRHSPVRVAIMPSEHRHLHLPGSGAQGPHGADLPARAWGPRALPPGAHGEYPSCGLPPPPVPVTASVGLGASQLRHHHCSPAMQRLQGRLGPAALGKRGGRSPAPPGPALPSARHSNARSLPQFFLHIREAGTISPILLNKETELRI